MLSAWLFGNVLLNLLLDWIGTVQHRSDIQNWKALGDISFDLEGTLYL
jgi:hypothetical protein